MTAPVPDATTLSALLLLADGRFPAGGHVHSGGAEAALADSRVRGHDDLEAFVLGRLHTAGLVEASLAAATVVHLTTLRPPVDPTPRATPSAPAAQPGPGRQAGADLAAVLARLDAEAEARLGMAPMRAASRRLGRQLTRAAGRCWPGPVLATTAAVHPDGPHQAVAIGAAAHTAGAGPDAAATLTLHHALTTPLQAALRLGGLDPFAVAALAARFGPVVAALAAEAAAAARGPLADLPCAAGPLTEIASVEHQARAERLFAT